MKPSAWVEKGLPQLVEALLTDYRDGVGINHEDNCALPNRHTVFACLDRLLAVLFPGILDDARVCRSNLQYHIGDLLHQVFGDLTREVACEVTYLAAKAGTAQPPTQVDAMVGHLLDRLPALRGILKEDVQAAFDGDPAATSLEQVIVSYPCIEAIATYRLAHELYESGLRLIPRLWSERAHSRTGIDINPGATIGPRFFIDHGTGVVIGETSLIGRNVALYQGVTLGALAPAKGRPLVGKKRHPTIEDNVIIYAGATILGGQTTIGEGCVIGGNVWLTKSVPAGTKVFLGKTDLVYQESKSS